MTLIKNQYRQLSIEDAKQIAVKNKGKLLSNTYINANSPLEWECRVGHTWSARLGSMRTRNVWCAKCAAINRGNKRKGVKTNLTPDNKFSEHKIKEISSQNGYTFIRSWTQNWKTRFEVVCKNGHKQEKCLETIKYGCKKCYCELKINTHPVPKDKILKVCRDKNLEFISLEKIKSRLHIKVRCYEGEHENTIYWGNLQKEGRGCPQCGGHISEEIVRLYFETLFGMSFKSCFPDWLKSSRGTRLQLDGYNKELKVAFEHQGYQHYSDTPDTFFLKDPKIRKMDDRRKIYLCKKQGVKLIVIPQLGEMTSLVFLRKKIISFATKNDINLIENATLVDINTNGIFHKTKMDKIHKKCERLKGKCLSQYYPGYESDLILQCDLGHIWKSSPHRLFTGNRGKGSWCRQCDFDRIRAKCEMRKKVFWEICEKLGHRPSLLSKDQEERLLAQSASSAWSNPKNESYDKTFHIKYCATPTKQELDRKRILELCNRFIATYGRIPKIVGDLKFFELFLGRKLRNISKYDKNIIKNMRNIAK